MKTKRTIELTVESRSLSVLRRSARPPAVAWCDACNTYVQMVTPEEAARLVRVNVRGLYRLIETGQVHFKETAEGYALVCLDSLT